MQMLMSTNKNNLFPMEEGQMEDIYIKLFEFIDKYDTGWKHKIKPATEEQIEKLLEISRIREHNWQLPQVYRQYLEIMGQNDGGLLSKIMLGETDINNIIDIFAEYDIYDPEFFEKGVFPFCSQDTGVELAFVYKTEADQGIWRTEGGQVFDRESESFEKLLFQCAFMKFVFHRLTISYGTAQSDLNVAMKRNNISNLFLVVNEIAEKYGMSKAWFSDERYYVGMGKNIVFYMKYDGAACGRISGENEQEVNNLFHEIKAIAGARQTNIVY